MKRIYAAVCAAIILVSSVSPVSYAQDEIEIHVSVDGSSTGDGTLENPVDSINSAKNLAKNYAGQPVKVLFHEGVYKVDTNTSFSAENSGALEAPVIYTAYGDAEVEFTGATQLNADGFTNVSDASVLKRIPQNARGNVLAYNLSQAGLTYTLEDKTIPYLYVNDSLKTTARYPNDGHLWATLANGTVSFTFNDYDISKWESAKDAVLSGSIGTTYFWNNTPITVSQNTITAGSNVRKNTEFWVENLLEELDAPGEYFVDRDTNILYYYPSEDITNAKIEITSFFDTVITMKNTKNVTFDGLKFDKFGAEVFNISGADNVNIINCVIDYSQGTNTIYFDGVNSVIGDNSFYGCANNVIEFHGGSVRTNPPTPGNVEIKNNRISMCGYYGKNSIISSGSSSTQAPKDFANKVSNNLIQDCMTFMCIVINANDYLINNNEIVNQGYLIGDGGAIYMYQSNAKHGIEVTHNYIHEGHKGDPAYAYCGLYSDGGYGGSYFHHNVVADMYQGMIMNVGMNCHFNNNLFINNYTASAGGSVMTKYTPDGGAVDRGISEMFYNEVSYILNKTTYGQSFAQHYPYLKETINRTPYFAVWDSELVGNVSIGCNGRGLNIRPWHLYYKKNSTDPVIAQEAAVLAQNPDALYDHNGYIGSYKVVGKAIDELKLYGKKVVDENGNDLNSTVLGNPILDYDDELFRDAENQDYTLTDKFSSTVSTVDEIDMSLMSIVTTTNPAIYAQKAREVELLSPADATENISEENIAFTWDRTIDASKYKLVIANDKNMTDPVLEETFNDTGDAIIKEKTLEPGKTYYWQVTAYGLAKNDTFTLSSDVYSFKTRDEGALNYESVNYVLGILDGYISDYEDGAIEFSDDTMYDGLVALSESTKTTIENATTKEEIDLCETEIIEKLIEAENCVSERIAEITECYVEQDSDNVYIKGTNFKNNSMISVLVTNPGNSIDDVEGASLSQIQYMDTVYSNGNGDISFSFKTRLNGKDRSGDYTVYIRNADGKTLTKTYNYGIISAGDITYKNADGEVIPDISECSGEQITMYCTITNDTQNDITPEIVTAFYNGSKLVDVSVDTSEDDARKVVANSKKELSWNVNVDTEGVTQIKVMFIESMITLKPLTSYRVIYEKE